MYIKKQYLDGPYLPANSREKTAWESLAAKIKRPSNAQAAIQIVYPQMQLAGQLSVMPLKRPGDDISISPPPSKRICLDANIVTQDGVKDILSVLEDVSTRNMEEVEPSKELALGLRSYQKQALGWLIAREQTKEERLQRMKVPTDCRVE